MNERLKNLFSKDKRTSNLVMLVVLLVVILIASNYIFDDGNTDLGDSRETISQNVVETKNSGLEEKLASIISKIDGIETVDVMVTYSATEKRSKGDTKSNI